MIFGFNTDVKHAETVYHVQSEARTSESLLETQVFVKGRCIGTRAVSYADRLQEPGFSEQQIHEMLKEQHRRFVAAAREGQIDAEFTGPQAYPDFPFPPGEAAPAETAPWPQQTLAEPPDPFSELVPSAEMAETPDLPPVDEPTIDAGVAVRAWSLHPVSAVIGNGLSFDCLPPVSAPGGAAITIAVQVADDSGPVPNADVTCRITSASGPASYVYAISSETGLADLPVSLDELDLATAALLIRVSLQGKSASRKYQLRQG